MKLKREKQATMIQTKDIIFFKKQDHRHKDVKVKFLNKIITLCKICGIPKIGYYDETAIYLKMNLGASKSEAEHD